MELPPTDPICVVIGCQEPRVKLYGRDSMCIRHCLQAAEVEALNEDVATELQNIPHTAFFTSYFFENDDEEGARRVWQNGLMRVERLFRIRRFLRERGLLNAAEAITGKAQQP